MVRFYTLRNVFTDHLLKNCITTSHPTHFVVCLPLQPATPFIPNVNSMRAKILSVLFTESPGPRLVSDT